MTIRTYGTLTRDGGEWILDVEPHVAMMVKRVFTRVTREGQKLTLKHNPETCRQLDWLTKLYPLTCPDQTQLDQIVVAHNDRLAEAERIVQPGYEPRVFDVKLPPRDYQRLGAELYLNSKSLLLADVVGAGKTLTAICSLCDPRTLPAVIVCPPHLLMQWERELTRCAPDLFVHTITKRRPYTLPTRDGRGPDVLLLSYFRADGWEDALRGYAKSVVFEEAQELRRRDSQKYQACKLIAADCEFRLQLSGTPIFNYGGEIYSLVQILRPDFLGDYEEFCREWCVGAWDKPRLKDPDAFGSFLREQHLMLRRTLKDIKRELPPLQKITQMIDADAKAMASIDGAAGELARTLMAETELTRGDKMRAAGDLEMLVRQATGIAKCLAPGTRVIKADGSLEVVENLKRGDSLLGPDSKPRRILDVASGSGEMFEVSSTAKNPLFAPYTVNADHILALKHSGAIRHGDRNLFGPYVRGDHIEISVADYLRKSKHFRRLLKGFKTGVEFPERVVPLDPYFLGLWLGDGTSDCVAVTTADQEIKDYLFEVAKSYGLHVQVKAPERTAPTYRLSSTRRGNRRKGRNTLLTILQQLGVINNKHIPNMYLVASRSQRMRLLAGLLDSDGRLDCPGGYTFVSRWRHLANEVQALAMSLGVAAKVKPIIAKDQNGNSFPAFRVSIYGNGLEDLPMLVPYKNTVPRRQIKDPLRSGISVKPVGLGPYFGFALEGDGLFLLHDFTVTHNSPYVAAFVELLLESDEPVVVFAWHRGVHDILASKLAKYRPAFYTGEESAVKKQTELDRFLTGDTNLLVISLRSGSGIDGLQFRCRTCVFAELDWSPAVHEQCYGRVARDGQTDPVTVYYLLADAGSDPPIAEMLGLKQSQIDGLMGVKHEGPFQQFDPTVAMRKLAESYLTKH